MEEHKVAPPTVTAPPPHMAPVTQAVLCRGGSRAISLDKNNAVWRKDITTDEKARIKCPNASSISSLCVTADGSQAVFQHRDTSPLLHDLHSGNAEPLKTELVNEWLAKEQEREEEAAALAAVAARGATANTPASSAPSSGTAIQNTNSARLTLHDTCVALNATSCVVGYDQLGLVAVWDVALAASLQQVLRYKGKIAKVAISEDSSVIAAATDCSMVIVWVKAEGGVFTEVRFEHLPPEEPRCLLVTSDNTHVILGQARLHALSIADGMRYELRSRPPLCAVTLGKMVYIGCEGGIVQIVRFGNAAAGADGVSTQVMQELHIDTDSIHRDVKAVCVSQDGLKITAAMIVQCKLQYIQWDLAQNVTKSARLLALKCMRMEGADGPFPAHLKPALSFILPVPEPELLPGQLGSIMAIGLDERVPCVVMEVLGQSSGQQIFRIVALPLAEPYRDGMEDFAGLHISVEASKIRPLSMHAFQETEHQRGLRVKLQHVALSQSQSLHSKVNPQETYDKTQVARALRQADLNAQAALVLLKSGTHFDADEDEGIVPEFLE